MIMVIIIIIIIIIMFITIINIIIIIIIIIITIVIISISISNTTMFSIISIGLPVAPGEHGGVVPVLVARARDADISHVPQAEIKRSHLARNAESRISALGLLHF